MKPATIDVPSRDTTGLIDRMFNELDLLHHKKITPARARASAALGTVIVEAAQLAIVHHRLKPRRNGAIRPAPLGTNIVEGTVSAVVVQRVLPRKRARHTRGC